MIRPAPLKPAVVALWCLAAAAGCAKLTGEAANGPVPARESATLPETPAAAAEPAAAPAPAAESSTPDFAPSPAAAPIAGTSPEPAVPPSAAVEAELAPPSTSTAELARSAPEPVVVAPAPPAAQEPARDAELAASAAPPPSDGGLDLESLRTRLRKTKAISLRTKLAVKKESDELLEQFRAYHAEHGTATLAELRRSYDSLFRKLHSLLEDADPPLARDIDRSRADIWAILADPAKFGASAASASTRRSPQA